MDRKDRQYIDPRTWFTGAWVPNWLLRRQELSPGAKLTYARLAQYWHPETGYAWPRQQVLAAELGISERHVRRWIAELVEAGLLEVQQVGLTRPNRYRFLDHPWTRTYVPEHVAELSDPVRTDTTRPDRSCLTSEQSFDGGLKSSQDADPELDRESSFGRKNIIEEKQDINIGTGHKHCFEDPSEGQDFDPRTYIRAILDEIGRRTGKR